MDALWSQWHAFISWLNLGAVQPLDWAAIALGAFTVLRGLLRGFIVQAMGLVGWLVAWVAAQTLTPLMAPALPATWQGVTQHPLILYLLVGGLVLALWNIAALLLRRLIRATPLAWPDRILGGALGGGIGLAMALALALIVGNSALRCNAQWRRSASGPWLESAWESAAPLARAWLPHTPSFWPFDGMQYPCAASSASNPANPLTN